MFYLLKSSFRRKSVGDVLIDLDSVEAVTIIRRRTRHEDLEEVGYPELFKVKVDMKSQDYWHGIYHSLEEAKTIVKEILGNRVSPSDIDEMETDSGSVK